MSSETTYTITPSKTTYTITPSTPVDVKLRIAADLITNIKRQLAFYWRGNEGLLGLCQFLEDSAKNPKNNEEYTKALTDAATALRAVLRFW